MIRVADYIMKRLEQEGIRHLFYVPGGQCVYLTDALRRSENIKGISMHHEQSVAMAALSYGQYNERLGAGLVTTGCAGTNTLTGVLHAWQDSIPCIFISGQQNVEQTTANSELELRQIGVQEANIVKLVSTITKYAVMLTKPDEVAYQLDKALLLAMTGRKGPVWIDVPLNIQNAMIEEEKLERYTDREQERIPNVTEVQISSVINDFSKAKRPVVFAGLGVRSAGAIDKLRVFAEKNHIPVVFTRPAADLFPYKHEYNFGVCCSVGAARHANFMVQNSDYLLVLGNRLSIDTTGPQQKDLAREAKIVVVDIDEIEHSKDGVRIDQFIHADVNEFLEEMNKANIKQTDSWWLEKCNHWKDIFLPYPEEAKTKNPIDVKYFLDMLSRELPEHCAVLSDAGMAGAVVPSHCHLGENGRLLHAYAQGEMGYTLPGAVGVSCLCDGPVVAISGDGSFMMNLQELQTVIRNQGNIKVIIINNNGYSGVRHGQKAHFRGKSIGTDSSNGLDFPDFKKVVEAFGIRYCKISNVEEVETKIGMIFEHDGPFVCEVMCDPEQYDLHNALVMYGKRKFGFRPIEDQSPFLDRDTFFEEMIVEPLETSYGKPM